MYEKYEYMRNMNIWEIWIYEKYEYMRNMNIW